MSYSEDNARSMEVLKLIRPFRGYSVLVNLAYAKGVWILKKMPGNNFKFMFWFSKNAEAVRIMSMKGWHPDPKQCNIKENELEGFERHNTQSSDILRGKFIKNIRRTVADLKTVARELNSERGQINLNLYLNEILSRLV